MKTFRLYSLVMVLVLCLSQSSAFADDKKWSTYQRQVNLMKRINEAQKAKQLTVRQAKNLRKDLSKIAVKKQRIRDDQVGKTGAGDMSGVEERLTEISEKINELKQENIKDANERVADANEKLRHDNEKDRE